MPNGPLATGSPFDDDDLWLPNKLARQTAEATATGADMIVCDTVDCHPDGRRVPARLRVPPESTYTKEASSYRWWALPCATLVKRSVFCAVGGYDVGLRHAEDVDFCRRVSFHHVIHQMDETLVHVRKGHDQLTKRVRQQACYELVHLLKMWRDTPPGLRAALPSFCIVALPRIMMLTLPKVIRQPLHPDRLRRRWARLRAVIAAAR